MCWIGDFVGFAEGFVEANRPALEIARNGSPSRASANPTKAKTRSAPRRRVAANRGMGYNRDCNSAIRGASVGIQSVSIDT